MAKVDFAVLVHLEWLGFVQPTGLVVSAPALVRAGAILDRSDIEGQRLLRACVEEREFDPKEGPTAWLPDFRSFASTVLGWSFSPKGYAGTPASPLPTELEVPLVEYGETLRPDFAVREMDPQEAQAGWQLLVRELESGQNFDRIEGGSGQLEASAHGRMERLLRETRVPAGLLFNGRALRLVSAPRGESSGWLDFKVADMVQTSGRPISTALRLLLSESRLLSLPTSQRLAALLEDSRKFQNEVSERLAQQVLHALYELLRGFQAAHDATKGDLLREPLAEHPDEVYRALLIVILRLVFLLYGEERDMLAEDDGTFLRYYSLSGLYERLRDDAALFPDTMDQRYGAWAQLLVLFRMIHDGAESGAMYLPKRHGVLFDPDRFKFLEGRPSGGARQIHERVEPPLVPDGNIYRALDKLLMLDGERISYRALDVEQIGSVYETMMGFRLETAIGRSVAIRARKKQGAPTAVDLEALLGEPGEKREKWIADRADRKLSDTAKKAAKDAVTLEDLHAALAPIIDVAATPDLVPRGSMVLQPSEERRRSGSHYTPRALTEPIVRTTLEPILARLAGEEGRAPRPDQILDLKVCDPAMGSGAFLVEACRQLGDALVEAWRVHDEMPAIPPDEREDIFAMRLVAQRCLYGVDRNPVAVDLAKVSLWLVTLAKDHALTFLDHALRHGDSLVGLSRKQIEGFHWDPDAPRFAAGFETMRVREHMEKVAELRRRIRQADESVSDWELRDLWDEARFEGEEVRLFGDLVVAAYFEGEKPRDREAKRSEHASAVVSGEVEQYRGQLEEWRHAEPPLAPFHWEIEFPEVFDRQNPGFEAFTGNPPFAGKNALARSQHHAYPDWLKTLHSGSHGNSDLIAHFYRRAFDLLQSGGALGLIATNTIAQGDTRRTGLLEIRRRGGEVFYAQRRLKWPGQAAVVVSIVCIQKGAVNGWAVLDGAAVERVTAFLVSAGGDEDPQPLLANIGRAVQGPIFPAHQQISAASGTLPIDLIRRVNDAHPRLRERIREYIGGEEFLDDPKFATRRWVVDLDGLTREECTARAGFLFEHVQTAFAASGGGQGTSDASRKRAERFWLPSSPAREARKIIDGQVRFLMHPFTASYLSFGFLPRGTIVGGPHNVFAIDDFGGFAVLQSRVHELWVRFFGSSLEDRQRYTPTDCFSPFPFPPAQSLEGAGRSYYEFRTALMATNGEGLTKTYKRFHDPDQGDPATLNLRELHSNMDRAVLDAYGWTDIPTDCAFFLDYEIDEEEWGSRKKPYHYRWPDEVHDEVLGRLLELNAARAKEEALIGVASRKQRGKKTAIRRAPTVSDSQDLFS